MKRQRFLNKALVSGVLICSMLTCNIKMVYGSESGLLNNFKSVKVFKEGMFRDVSSKAWYGKDVKYAYEMGLMSGKEQGKFDPNGNITIAEALVVASRIHATYSTGDSAINGVAGEPWYMGSVRYAEENAIITKGEFSNVNKPATRAELLRILKGSLPVSEFEVVNNVVAIPDMPTTHAYYDEVLFMYNVGITSGSDKKGNSNYSANINRAESAAIISRVINKNYRRQFTLETSNVKAPRGGAVVYVEPTEFDGYGKQGLMDKPDKWFSSKIVTKYGTHTYNTINQKQYNAVVGVVEKARTKDGYFDKAYTMFTVDEKVRKHYIESRGLLGLEEAGVSKQDMNELAKFHVLKDLTYQVNDGKLFGKGGTQGESAYTSLFLQKGDCTGDAMVMQAIADVAGLNSIVVADRVHEWIRVQTSSGNWYQNTGVGWEKDFRNYEIETTQETNKVKLPF